MRDREAEEFIVKCIHVVNAFEARKESVGRTNGGSEIAEDGRERRVGGVETRQDRGAGGRMAVRIYGRFITLPALPRLL
ncbi:hypothetical protein ALC60_06518 [Trachymyrmex zeteki]|uniref:Uncharacterized protein n=3 Tax=Attini TaxID=143999 RepID=A0A195EVE1_9HYME|nr:hypothetical protein G5I_07249 [Acromyrmex echinatior]KYN32116.1 hypothetical protein ALC56_13494 [Trachymyrmex septentrionalis]KYQ54602.1 hypothetical protein ALC60_06518 [Trachymyrmex zeteki]